MTERTADSGPTDQAPKRGADEPNRSGGRRWAAALARFVLGAAILAGLIWFLGPDWSEVGRRLRVAPSFFALGLVGTVFAAGFGAIRWRLLNEHLTPTRLPLGSYFHYVVLTRLIGQFSSMLLMEFVGRGVGLRTAGSKQGLGQLVLPVILERVVDVIFPLIMLGWAIAVHTGGGPVGTWPWSLVGVLLAATVVIVPLVRPAARTILWVYCQIQQRRGRVADVPPVLLPWGLAFKVTLLGLGRYVSVLVQFIGIAAAVGAVTDVGVVASAFPVSQLSAIIAITPGGLGIQDAGWAGALAWQSVDETSIAMFVLAIHAGIVVNFGILSVLTLPLSGRQSRMRAGATAPLDEP